MELNMVDKAKTFVKANEKTVAMVGGCIGVATVGVVAAKTYLGAWLAWGVGTVIAGSVGYMVGMATTEQIVERTSK